MEPTCKLEHALWYTWKDSDAEVFDHLHPPTPSLPGELSASQPYKVFEDFKGCCCLCDFDNLQSLPQGTHTFLHCAMPF
jgi:hypothetical protein